MNLPFVLRCAVALVVFAPGCSGVLDDGPFGVRERPFVEGRWAIRAFVDSSDCGIVRDESFTARVVQNRDLIQFVVEISGFGDVRYDGRLDRDGDFLVRQSTVFTDIALLDESTVEGRFAASGRTLVATEFERLEDLRTGQRCTVVWRWRGDRR